MSLSHIGHVQTTPPPCLLLIVDFHLYLTIFVNQAILSFGMAILTWFSCLVKLCSRKLILTILKFHFLKSLTSSLIESWRITERKISLSLKVLVKSLLISFLLFSRANGTSLEWTLTTRPSKSSSRISSLTKSHLSTKEKRLILLFLPNWQISLNFSHSFLLGHQRISWKNPSSMVRMLLVRIKKL